MDHGEVGSGETVAGMLRTGSAGANTAADHITVLDQALAQLPENERRAVLVRTDTGGGSRTSCNISPTGAWNTPSGFAECHRSSRPWGRCPGRPGGAAIRSTATGTRAKGAKVAELTAWLPDTLRGWPTGTRVIARRQRPHHGAQTEVYRRGRLADHLLRDQHQGLATRGP